MSSPSPGKRRMDTDVVKLYPFLKINKDLKQPHQACFYHPCQLLNVDFTRSFLVAVCTDV